jgi:hypothetical protein
MLQWYALTVQNGKGENDLIVKSFWSRAAGIFDYVMTPARVKLKKSRMKYVSFEKNQEKREDFKNKRKNMWGSRCSE